jgi:hypothetical protein
MKTEEVMIITENTTTEEDTIIMETTTTEEVMKVMGTEMVMDMEDTNTL